MKKNTETTGKILASNSSEISVLLSSLDGSTHPLGYPESWSNTLINSINISLHSSYPTFVWWGEDLFTFYNDAAISVLEGKHPQIFGQSAKNVLPDGAEQISLLLTAASTEEPELWQWLGSSVTSEKDRLSFSHTPLFDKDGSICGIMVIGKVTDITLVKKKVEESEERYRAFVSQSSEAIWRYEFEKPVDTSLPIKEQIDQFYQFAFLAECNDAMAKMYGFEKSTEIIGARMDEMLPASEPINIDYLRAFIKGEYQLTDAESHEIDIDGKSLWFLNNLIGIVEDGHLIRVWGTQRDITKRKQLEEQVRSQYEELENIYRTAPIGRALIDLNLCFVRINEWLAEINGMSASEHIGRSICEVVPGIADQVEQIFRQVRETGEPILNVEVAGDTKVLPGVHRVWKQSWYPLKDASGKMIAINVVVEEITERKRADETLHNSENQLRLITDAVPGLISYVDSEHHYRFINKMYTEWFGHKPADIVGKHIRDVLGEEAYEVILPAMNKVLSGEKLTFERSLPYKGLGNRFVNVSYIPHIQVNGKIEGYFSLVQDITERKLRELNAKFLDDISKLFAYNSDIKEIMQVVGEKTARHFNVSRVFFVEVDEVKKRSIVLYDWCNEDMPSTVGVYQLEEYVSEDFLRELIAGNPVVINDVKSNPITVAAVEKLEALQIGSSINAPYLSDGKLKFMLAIQHASAYNWREDEVELMRELTARVWIQIERTRAVEALKERENELLTLANSIPQLAWMAEPDGSVFWFNERWYEYTGTTPEQMKGWGRQSVHDPEMLPLVVAGWQNALTKGESWEMEFPLRGADGIFRWFLTRGNPLRDSQGKIVRWFGTNTDIDELRRMRETIAASERDLQELANSMPQLVWIANAEGIVQYYNNRAMEYAGIQKNKQGSWDWQPVLHPEDLQPTVLAWQTAVANKQLYVKEHRIKMQDGTYRWHLSRGIPIVNEQGNLVRWYGTATDIDDLKQTQQALIESEQYFRKLADAAPVMIWQAGLDKNCYYFNKGWQEFTGCALQSDEHCGWAERAHPQDLDRCLQAYAEAFDRRESFAIEYRLQRHDGEYRWVLDHGVPTYDHNGLFTGFIGSCIDIDEKKTIEEQKEAFVQIAGHELRTPLTSLLGYLSILRRTMDMTDPAFNSQQKAYESALKMKVLIQDFLDIFRIRQGQILFEMGEFDFSKLVKETIENTKSAYPKYNIQLQGQTGVMIKGDRNRLEQVISNLLNNAIKYSIESYDVDVILWRENDTVKLVVKDYGIGIEAGEISKIFNKFHRAPNTGKIKGMGLGLYLVKQIVDFHQGIIEVASQKGEGTTITLELPIIVSK